MSVIGVGLQHVCVFNDMRARRIEVDVGHKPLEVPAFLAKNGFVTVLEQMPVAPTAAIKADGVPGG